MQVFWSSKHYYFIGLIFNRKVERSILEQVNYGLIQLCVKNGYHFIDNSKTNIAVVDLYKDSLYLNNYGKDELANNLINDVDSILWESIFRMIDF